MSSRQRTGTLRAAGDVRPLLEAAERAHGCPCLKCGGPTETVGILQTEDPESLALPGEEWRFVFPLCMPCGTDEDLAEWFFAQGWAKAGSPWLVILEDGALVLEGVT